MATSYTSLLGLALPVTGELSGTWGDTVNDSITSLLDTAVAGTTTLSTDGDVTLTTTTGASNQARQAILLCTGARTALRTITAPARSKIYTVINATTGGYSVKVVGAGPTTGVTIVAGESATIAWNGSDFIKVSNTAGGGTFTDLTVTNSETLSYGTANGVAYLNGSKVLTSGSALTFDGTQLSVGGGTGLFRLNASSSDYSLFKLAVSGTNYANIGVGTSGELVMNGNSLQIWQVGGSEQMRLTSTGLGIGTSSPLQKADVRGNLWTAPAADTGDNANQTAVYFSSGSVYKAGIQGYRYAGSYSLGLDFYYSDAVSGTYTRGMRLDSSGNLGLGVTPSAWASFTGLQVGALGGLSIAGAVDDSFIGSNVYYNAGFKFAAASAAYATAYRQSSGQHRWLTSTATGTAGNTATMTQAMTLDASGNLLIGGTTAPSESQARQLLATSSSTYLQFARTSTTIGGSLIGTSGQNFIIQTYTGAIGSETYTERARIDSSGNFGLGVTPSAWQANTKAIDIGSGSAIWNPGSDTQTQILTNAYNNGTNFIFKGTGTASRYRMTGGQHEWYSSTASGTAGGTITFTQAMTLDASGVLGIGDTSPSSTAGALSLVGALGRVININSTSANGGGLAITKSGVDIGFLGAAKWSYGGTYSATDFNLYAVNNQIFGTNGTERARIDSSGSLAVGTTTASYTAASRGNVSIGGANGGILALQVNGTASGYLFSYSTAMELWNGANTPLIFGTNNIERARFDASGNLQVGTTTNRGQVSVQGYPTSLPTVNFYRDNTDANYVLAVRHDGPVIGSGGTGYMIQFQDRNGGALGTITSSGTGSGSTAYNTSSDYRLKHDVEPMANALVKVAALKPVTYKWNADNSDGQGFIAHELQEVFPEAVTGVKDEMEEYLDESDNTIKTRPRYQGIDTSFLVATLTAAIQEQQAIIETLTARVAALESK